MLTCESKSERCVIVCSVSFIFIIISPLYIFLSLFYYFILTTRKIIFLFETSFSSLKIVHAFHVEQLKLKCAKMSKKTWNGTLSFEKVDFKESRF